MLPAREGWERPTHAAPAMAGLSKDFILYLHVESAAHICSPGNGAADVHWAAEEYYTSAGAPMWPLTLARGVEHRHWETFGAIFPTLTYS